MDFSLNDEQRMILDTVRQFVTRELMPLERKVVEAEIENRAFPDPETLRGLRSRAKDLGLWGLTEPKEYGGADLGSLTAALVTIETSRALVPFQYGGHVPNLLYSCTPAQRSRYLLPLLAEERRVAFAMSEPNIGTDAGAMQTTAVWSGTHWVINGQKTWISRGHKADFAIVLAVTDKALRARGGITAFLVDREMGFESRPLVMMAQSDMGDAQPAELNFKDTVVPAENVLGEVGNGLKAAMATIGHSRIQASARAIGAAQRLLEMAVEYAKVRISFGKPLADYQAIQWMLADSAVELRSALWLTLHAGWKVDQGLETRFEESMAKLTGAQTAWRVADRVLQIHGAMGYSKELPIERVMRQLRVYRIYEGADELQKINIAKGLINGSGSLTF
jgi:acyl-CoA dehydrogenase